jgi:hypothetical protein
MWHDFLCTKQGAPQRSVHKTLIIPNSCISIVQPATPATKWTSTSIRGSSASRAGAVSTSTRTDQNASGFGRQHVALLRDRD